MMLKSYDEAYMKIIDLNSFKKDDQYKTLA